MVLLVDAAHDPDRVEMEAGLRTDRRHSSAPLLPAKVCAVRNWAGLHQVGVRHFAPLLQLAHFRPSKVRIRPIFDVHCHWRRLLLLWYGYRQRPHESSGSDVKPSSGLLEDTAQGSVRLRRELDGLQRKMA